MIQISNVAQSIESSLTRKLFDMAKSYPNVIDFTLGDPDIFPELNIRQAACDAIMQGKTRYSQNAGLIDLRNTISSYYEKTESLKYCPQKEIIVTVGGMEGLFLTLLSTINPKDEVIITAPYWVNYKQMVQLCGATPVIVETDENLNFPIEGIKKAITSKTKAIIINTPSNPSGRIINQSELKTLSDLVIEKDLTIISDEVYKKLIYDGATYKSIVHFDGMRERTVLINSLSKEFCMTGWRIGYVLAPETLISTMSKLQENIVACAPLPSQYAAMEALKAPNIYSVNMIAEFTRRRAVLLDELSKIEKISYNKPDATFYFMVNIKKTGLKSEDFAYRLLEKEQVAVVPGITYGQSCEGYIRIAFTLSEDKIREGAKRIGKFINEL
jgi:Aspartate/tyrosine/aromatic aminotransferase